MNEGRHGQLFQAIGDFRDPESLHESIGDLDIMLQEMPLADMGTETAQQIVRLRNMLAERLSDIIQSESRTEEDRTNRVLSPGETPEDWFLLLEEPTKKRTDDTLIPETEMPDKWTARGRTIH
jgi:hypothetical protein